MVNFRFWVVAVGRNVSRSTAFVDVYEAFVESRPESATKTADSSVA